MRSTYSQFILYSLVAVRSSLCAPVDIRARQLPDNSQSPEPFDPESNFPTPGLPDDVTPSDVDDINDFQRESPDLDQTERFTPTERFDDEGDDFRFPSSVENSRTLPGTDTISSNSQRQDSVTIPDNDDISLSDSGDFDFSDSDDFDFSDSGDFSDDDSLLNRINSNSLPDPDTSDLQSYFSGNPVEDQPMVEILEGIQTVQEFPVNDDGTMSDDDIDELRDTLDDEEEQIEELVDEGRLSKSQGILMQSEIEPLKTGLDVIDESSIDTGDRMIDGGKTVASVLDPTAGTTVGLLDEVGILDPIGSFLGDAFDATIGAIFKK